MLVLSRKVNQKIRIGDHITVTVVESRRGKLRLGIEAPKELKILRGELTEAERNDEEAVGAF